MFPMSFHRQLNMTPRIKLQMLFTPIFTYIHKHTHIYK